MPPLGPRLSVAVFVVRLVVGLSFITHGASKLAHPTSWDGPQGSLPGLPGWLQLVITVVDNVGGWCMIFGFLTPLVAALQTGEMVVVTFVVKMGHGLPYFSPKGQDFEIEAHLLAGALAILLCGPGLFSIDALIRRVVSRREAPTRSRTIGGEAT
jgi:uncharacterized membrane protein YphA (DoxX/SURF4 family)